MHTLTLFSYISRLFHFSVSSSTPLLRFTTLIDPFHFFLRVFFLSLSHRFSIIHRVSPTFFYLCSFRFYIKLLVPRRSTKFFTILSFLIVALSPLFLRIFFVQFVSQIFSFLSFFIFFIFLSNLSNLCFTNWIRSRKIPIPCSVFTIVVLRCDFLFLEL